MADEKTPYDNTNRGALWPVKGFRGKLNIDGSDRYVQVVATGANTEGAPAYMMIVRDGTTASVVPVFRSKNSESKSVASAKYANHWVNFFVNEKWDNPQAPTMRLWARPIEQTRDPIHDRKPSAPTPPPVDDLPF